MSDEQQPLIFNGINGATGNYLLPEMSAQQISQIVRGEPLDEEFLKELNWRYRQATIAHLGLEEGRDPKNLAESGWGIVFAYEDADQVDAIKEALSPLLKLREKQAGGRNTRRQFKAGHADTEGGLYQEFDGPASVRPGESKNQWLARHGGAPGPVVPPIVPYYLLLVGSPERIPYRFQYQLGVQHAVGRIHFETLEEYARYADSVIAAETAQKKRQRRAVFFGVHNKGDVATSQSTQQLVVPLAASIQADQPSWKVETVLKDEATKARLGELLGGNDTPDFLFTASHGMGFPKDDPRQLTHQGALLCQDWPGPIQWPRQQPIPEDYYFSGNDVVEDARLHGLISFHFACYGAGTPQLDDFAHQAFRGRVDIAPHAFVAQLPQRLLAHPRQGGALAFVGHVERAWTYSFLWDRAGQQTAVFKSTLKRLMEGHPIGSALEFFPERFAEISVMLNDQLEDIKFGARADDIELSGLWTANNDARSYVIIGDPAVRLGIDQSG
jgi:hypothetical protein